MFPDAYAWLGGLNGDELTYVTNRAENELVCDI